MHASPSLVLIICALLAVSRVDGLKRRYDGDQVFRITPQNEEQLHLINAQFLNAPYDQYAFWREPSMVGQFSDLHVNVEWIETFTSLMEMSKIPYKVVVEDVQRLIDDADAKSAKAKRSKNARSTSILNTYPHVEDTYAWLKELCAAHPTITSCGIAGQSFEKRTIDYIRIGSKPADGVIKKKVIFEGGMHGTEWLGPATVISIINNLVSNYEKDVTAKRMVDTFDWIIIPHCNPDGYEHSRSYERLWRKTRSRIPGSYCIGADPNRNWDSWWGEPPASKQPCADKYAGTAPFSEIEAKTLSEFIADNRENAIAYFSIHTFSQHWLLPFGAGEKPSDYDELLRVAQIGGKALMDVYNTKWEIGHLREIMYPATGGSIDWVKNTTGIKYVYCIELRPTQQDPHGGIVPTTEIEMSFREVWAGIVAAVDAMIN